jgi:hypothetical protein
MNEGQSTGKVVWIPEGPRTVAGPLYAIKEGGWGPLGNVSTLNVHEARQFETEAECEEWCKANPIPMFFPREHVIG